MTSPVDEIIRLDWRVNEELVRFRKPCLTTFLAIVTQLGSGPFGVLLYGIAFIYGPSTWMPVLAAVIEAELAMLLIILALRYLTRRPRPCPDRDPRLLDPWNRFSFPSHHSARMTMWAVVLGTQHLESIVILLPAAILVGFSRLCLGKHFLSDVLVGASVGGLVATAVLF